jgi:alanyl-tRNA synthetase
MKAIASALSTESGVVAVLVSPGSAVAIVVARSLDITLDSSKALRTLLDRFGGRGGGRPELAQGAGLVGKIDDILAAAREIAIA